MKSPKERTLALLNRLNDDVTFGDIQYGIYVLQKIQRGLKDIEEGRVVSHEEARRQIARWR